VEGLADLIGAETEAQRRQAFRQLTGALGRRADTWREKILQALALIEAGIDFADEGDVPPELATKVRSLAVELQRDILETLKGAARAERVRDGLVVAIAGPPNAGKSTLFNTLARRDVAIVSAIPGTTRDVLEVHLDLAGYPVTVLDTAGIRESKDPVEQEGIARAHARAAAADLTLWLTEPDAPVDRIRYESKTWMVFTKIDLIDSPPKPSREEREGDQLRTFSISAVTGQGLEELLQALERFVEENLGEGEAALVTRQRQRLLLENAAAALNRASKLPTGADDLLAEELRAAAADLGRLLGRIDVEDVLDAIFRDFCIGK
jgi:tRNA modification GTPase